MRTSIGVVFIFVAAATAAQAADERADTNYAVAGKGFMIKYPEKWRKVAEGEGGVRFANADGTAVVSVDLTNMPQNFDFQTFFRMEAASAKKLTDFKELDNTGVSIAGHNAKKFAFTFSQNGANGASASYYLFKGKKPSGYTIFKISCNCKADDYEKFKGTFEEIATSFDFEN